MKYAKISEVKCREIIRYFSLDIEASKIAFLSDLGRQSINAILKAIRERIAEYCEEQSLPLGGEAEIEESYFGAPRGRGARGKTWFSVL